MPSTATRPRRRRIAWPCLATVLGVAVVAWLADFLSKEWVLANFREGETRQVLGEALQFTFVRNPGAAFSMFENATWFFTLLAAAVTVAIVVVSRRIRSPWWALVLGALLGGVVGNLTDRLIREPGNLQGHVIDFINVWGFPAIFNIADICIVGSMMALVLLMLLGINLDGTREQRPEPEATAKPVEA